MDRIEKTYLIAAPVEEVWRALTDPEVIAEWSHAPAVYEAEPGAAYSLWNGDIQGEILEVVPLERLVKTWKPANWTTNDSTVTFSLVPDAESTRVDLVHENVEAFDLADTDEGWDTYYLGVIKNMLEAQPESSGTPKTEPAAAKKRATLKKASAKKSAAKKSTLKRASKKAAAKKAAKKTTGRKGAAKKSAKKSVRSRR